MTRSLLTEDRERTTAFRERPSIRRGRPGLRGGRRLASRPWPHHRSFQSIPKEKRDEFSGRCSAIESSNTRHTAHGPDHIRRERSRHQVPADSRPAPAEGRAQRACDPDRRLGLRRHQRLRRSVPDAELREAGEGRAAVHALPHDRVVLSDASGITDRPQPSFCRHGRDHRDRHGGPGYSVGAAQQQGAAAQ